VQIAALHPELQFLGRLRSLRPMSRSRFLPVFALLFLLVFAACGSGGGAAGAEPASAVADGTAM
jgi:hypothetical protein